MISGVPPCTFILSVGQGRKTRINPYPNRTLHGTPHNAGRPVCQPDVSYRLRNLTFWHRVAARLAWPSLPPPGLHCSVAISCKEKRGKVELGGF